MSAATYHKGTWKAEVSFEQLANGKYRGVVLLFREGQPSTEQIYHRTIDELDTADGALTEGKVLAQRVLGEL